MRVDESDLRTRFHNMSSEEFSRVQRSDLTEAGQRIYDDEAGRRVPTPTPSGFAKCSNCAADVLSETKFCSVCGQPVSTIQAPSAAKPTYGDGLNSGQRVLRALGSIALWIELVWGLALVDSFLRDIGAELPHGLVALCALLLSVGVIVWRVRGGNLKNGLVLIVGLALLVVGTVVGVIFSSGVFVAKNMAKDRAERQMPLMPIEKLAGEKLKHDRSYCGDVVKIQGTVRELNAAETALTGGAKGYALESNAASMIVLQNRRWVRLFCV